MKRTELQGDVHTGGGDFVGRDKVIHGDEVRGDKIGGDKVQGDKISAEIGENARNVVVGKNIRQTKVDEAKTTIFDQRGQKVNYQYNAGGDINFGAVQNQMNVVSELEKLQAEVAKAIAAGVVEEEVATDVKYQVDKATQQAKKPEADKKTIVDYLTQAQTLLVGITAASGLVTAFTQAIEAVQKVFK